MPQTPTPAPSTVIIVVNVEIANAKNSILFPSFLSNFYLIKEKAQKLSITFPSSFLTSGHNIQKFYFLFDTPLLDIMSKSFVSLLSPPLLDIMSKGFAFSFWHFTSGHYVQKFDFPFFALHFWTLRPKVCFLFFALHFWTLCPKVSFLFGPPLLDIMSKSLPFPF